MRVIVLLPSVLRAPAGGASRVELDVTEQSSLGEVLDVLVQQHPALGHRLRNEQGALRRYINFYLDGEECRRLDGAATVLGAGTEIQIIPSVAGG